MRKTYWKGISICFTQVFCVSYLPLVYALIPNCTLKLHFVNRILKPRDASVNMFPKRKRKIIILLKSSN